MILWWLGDILLLLVVAPIVAILLGRVLGQARAIVPSVYAIRDAARRGSSDLDAVPLLLTTQDQVKKTVEGVANYGGSLDVIVDDA
jgi:ABC-type methionine transport system permease subunit